MALIPPREDATTKAPAVLPVTVIFWDAQSIADGNMDAKESPWTAMHTQMTASWMWETRARTNKFNKQAKLQQMSIAPGDTTVEIGMAKNRPTPSDPQYNDVTSAPCCTLHPYCFTTKVAPYVPIMSSMYAYDMKNAHSNTMRNSLNCGYVFITLVAFLAKTGGFLNLRDGPSYKQIK